MPAMTFEEFKKYTADNIKQFLPLNYQNGEVSVYRVTKLGSTYTGMSVRTGERRSAVTVNLNRHYIDYVKDERIERVMREVAQTIMMNQLGNDLEWITDYDKAKEKLFIRVSNAITNEEVISRVPHIQKEDLVLTCHVLVSNDEAVASTIVSNPLLEAYGVTEEKLFEDAIENSQKLFPIQMQPLESLIFDMAEENGIEYPTNGSNHLMVVTNNHSINGASALFYPDAMDRVADMIHDDYYIIPSSIHECIVIPESDHISYEHLEKMLHEVNAAMVAREEQLSDHVYHYDSAEKLFEFAEDYVLRTRQSEYDFSTSLAM